MHKLEIVQTINKSLRQPALGLMLRFMLTYYRTINED